MCTQCCRSGKCSGLTVCWAWLRSQHGWETDAEAFVFAPSVVLGLHSVLQALMRPRDAVLVMRPGFPPLRTSSPRNPRQTSASEGGKRSVQGIMGHETTFELLFWNTCRDALRPPSVAMERMRG